MRVGKLVENYIVMGAQGYGGQSKELSNKSIVVEE